MGCILIQHHILKIAMLRLIVMAVTCHVLLAAHLDSSFYSELHSRARMFLTNTGRPSSSQPSTNMTSLLSRLRDEFLGSVPQTLKGLQDERTVNVSVKCANDTLAILAAAEQKQTWAIRMLDAMGKPASGILDGNIIWLGAYDECLSTVAVDSTQKTLFETRYCQIQLMSYAGEASSMVTVPTLGLCVPESCGQSDVAAVTTDVLQKIDQGNKTAQIICQERQLQLDFKAIVAICVCGIFIALLVVGTVYDVCMRQRRRDEGLGSKTPTDDASRNKRDSEATVNDADLCTSTVEIVKSEMSMAGPREDPEPAICFQIIGSFSLYTNAAKLLNTNQPTGSLTAVHGIRFISMTWVILGHSFFVLLLGVSVNVQTYLKECATNWTCHAVLNALVAVDTFFTISGLLVVYLAISEMKKSQGRVNWVMFYFHRFWRLTPVYMCVMMLDVCLLRYVSDGPLWPQGGIELNACRDTWWTNLLYVNNLVKRNEMCFGWSWYLANDMQFYILSPLIIIPLFFRQWLGFAVLAFFLLATMTTAGLVTRIVGIPVGFLYQTEGLVMDPFKFYDYYYTPYCRMGPYLVGMAVGYILAKNSCKVKMNNVTSLAGWCSAAAAALAVLYGPYESANGSPMTPYVGAFYNAVHRSVWGAAMSWVIFACATGHGGFVNTLLSWKGFVPLSRLTYSAYLVHMLILMTFTKSQRTPLYIDNLNVAFQFLAYVVTSYGAAFVTSLAFEAPMMGLEKVLFKRRRKH